MKIFSPFLRLGVNHGCRESVIRIINLIEGYVRGLSNQELKRNPAFEETLAQLLVTRREVFSCVFSNVSCIPTNVPSTWGRPEGSLRKDGQDLSTVHRLFVLHSFSVLNFWAQGE